MNDLDQDLILWTIFQAKIDSTMVLRPLIGQQYFSSQSGQFKPVKLNLSTFLFLFLGLDILQQFFWHISILQGGI